MSSAYSAYFTLRPPGLDDAKAIASLIQACALEQGRATGASERSVRASMQMPGLTLEADSRLAIGPRERVHGFALVQDTPPSPLLTALAAVHPDQRGQGIGTALCRWIEERCRQALARLPVGTSATVLQQVASTDRAARDLLIAQGYRVARHSFRMVLEMDASPAAPLDPEGIVLRPLVRETEAKALVQALREAFRDNWGYVERPFEVEYERWMNLLDREDGAETARYWLVAVDGSEIAGFALSRPRAGENPEDASLYVVGVRPAWRRRGIALALLQRTFRALYQGGARRVRLEVDAQNRTGATRLYEKVGMRLESRDDFYEKQLHPGEA